MRSGNVVWAWDVGQPENVTDPQKGRVYTRNAERVDGSGL
jgi:quinate dehydrogenase (quinone)